MVRAIGAQCRQGCPRSQALACAKNLLSALSIFIELQSPDARIAVNVLKKLRAKWGEENFDAAWKEATAGDVPDWLKG